jgi:disease resistance protein RPM1
MLFGRYFIIIDDIWNAEVWRVIKCAFPENDLGSRVIATTRIQDVAKACSSHHRDYILNMKPLSNEDSRRLFFSRIFGLEEACPHHLRDISLEILKKCGGLPLAIISISSMLASEGTQQKERWEHVRDSLSSGTNLTLNGVRQILNLSYIDLPCHLKTCLLYLGMYPEDYTIERFNLECQWIAEGFVYHRNM